MSKKSTVVALAMALAGLAAAPLAHSADAPANPTSAEQKNPCGPKKEAVNPCGPAKKKATNCLAAQELTNIQMRYAETGRTLNEAALCGAKDFVEWQHYPSNDLIDEVSGYEFYYHAHSADEMPNGEHGHFHVIKRDAKSFHHLIGIALNQKGLPTRLFTTNQWVTGEGLVDSRLIIKSIKGFDMAIKGRMAPVSKWVGALIQLFCVEIEELILERDQKIAQLVVEMGNRELVLNSRKHHVLTECNIDLMGRLSENLFTVNS
jgi:hypothetical protein